MGAFRGSTVACLLVVFGAAAGCDILHIANEDARDAMLPNDVVVDGIRAMLSVEPARVERGEKFTARLDLSNTLGVRAQWTSGMGCIAFLNVYRDSKRIPLRGTDFGCLAVVTTRLLEPGESLSTTWELVAQTTDGSALPAGTYTLEADPVLANGATLEHAFVIR